MEMVSKGAIISKETSRALSNGDHDAFEEVFRVYFSRIKAFINGIVKSWEDSEELAQDIFCKLWMQRESIDESKNIGSYLYTIARNTAFNHLAKENVRRTHMDYQSKFADLHTEFDGEIFARETELLIAMLVEKMPERRRQIFELSRHEGMTSDEIAETLNLTKKTVHNQLSLALKEIKDAVALMIAILFV